MYKVSTIAKTYVKFLKESVEIAMKDVSILLLVFAKRFSQFNIFGKRLDEKKRKTWSRNEWSEGTDSFKDSFV